jgi:hypothetical protein
MIDVGFGEILGSTYLGEIGFVMIAGVVVV